MEQEPPKGEITMRYAIWNNKGGVGKTFLTFILGAEYAKNNPDKNVILVDMCPQANLSEIILGGNGKGSAQLSEILSKGKHRLTSGGYFDNRINSPHKLIGIEGDYLVNGNTYNNELPKNLWLICGDPSLEIQAQVINQICAQTLPVEAWRNVHHWLLDLIQACSLKLENEIRVFIDCNPSFSAYTELAMTAANRLIIPCTSDGSSARAIDNVAALLYGIGMNEQHKPVNFANKAKNNGITLPKMHSIVLNRSTQWDKKASKAFQAMFGEIKERVLNFKKEADSTFFSSKLSFKEIPDTHSVSIVCSHYGMPLYGVTAKKYKVFNTNPQVNSEPLRAYKEKIADFLSIL